MTDTRRSKIHSIVAVHLLLACAPLAMRFLPPSMSYVPILWGLAGIGIAQFMLLSIWVGMTGSGRLRKALFAAVGCGYLAIWSALGALPTAAVGTVREFALSYFRNAGMTLLFVVVLSLAMSGASRFLGQIAVVEDLGRHAAQGRSQYSLTALFGVMTTVAIILGLLRATQESGPGENFIAEYLLMTVLFIVNIGATVWATLGARLVALRINLAFLVSLLLGISLATGAGLSWEDSSFQPWWLFATMSLVLVIPTAIISITLLRFRKLGYRLVDREQAQGEQTDAAASPTRT